MSNKSKKFYLTHATSPWGMMVQIDPDKAMPTIRQTAGWWGAKQINDEDCIRFFLSTLARECFYISMAERLDQKSFIKSFATRAGWPRMDGSKGITILSVSGLPNNNSFEIKEVK